MNILFLGCPYPREREKYIKEVSSFMDFAANNLQWALLAGLDNFANVKVISDIKIISEQKTLKGSRFSHREGSDDIMLDATSNVFSRKILHGRKIVKEAINSGYDTDVIFIYSQTLHFLHAASLLKTKNPKIKVVMIVPDLAEYMIKLSGLKHILKRIETRLCFHYMKKCVDGFILLSEGMKERLPIGKKPYTIVEGIFNTSIEFPAVKKTDKKVILYTGNLSASYGIEDLLNAFSRISGAEYRLWLRGNGNCESLVKERIKHDDRIRYFDRMPLQELYKLEKSATILVNPVHSNQEFTKYFFPSKTMEYMASGTPTLMSPLACIPEGYKKHLYFFDDESVEGMARKIEEVCEKSKEELTAFGKEASDFIYSQKNQVSQCKKIMDLIERIL